MLGYSDVEGRSGHYRRLSLCPKDNFSTIPANVYVEELSGFDLCTLREQAIQTYYA